MINHNHTYLTGTFNIEVVPPPLHARIHNLQKYIPFNAKKHTFCLRPLSHNFGISCHWQAFWHWPMNCTPSTLSTSSCLQTWTQKRLGAVQWLVTDRRVHLPSQFVATAVQKRCRGVRQLINQAQASLNQPGRQTACQSHHRKGNQIRQARCRAVQ